jgi:ubiquinol-cytochrome c reductase cytochrome b subunit
VPSSDALTRFADWFDSRTDYRAARAALWERRLPQGPRWTYATGACSLALFVVVAATGLLLMANYSPASDHGWSSVFLIESTPGGSFVRGLHYYGSHALVILFAIHLARLILTASYRAPRELAWIAGLLLLPVLAGEAVTGNPLSASNKAVGQIEIESHIVGNMPVVGAIGRGLLVGGDEVGNLTMTRLYTLHVALLPLLAGLLLAFHVYQQLRWGTITPEHNSGAERASSTPDAALATSLAADHGFDRPTYWPNQTARNALVFGVVFGVVALLAWRYGAPLDAPADPMLDEMPRPEWYFRSLFELRGYFNGAVEFIATGLLPSLCLAFLAALPWLDRRLPPFASHVFRYAVVILAASGWTVLTAMSFARDRDDPMYRKYLVESAERSQRAQLLASMKGVPTEGPAALLRHDPLTQGPKLFERHCANCHPHLDANGNGIEATTNAASNLYGFATRDWISGLLDPDKIAGPGYYGHTAFVKKEGKSQGMIEYIRDELYAVEDDALAQRKAEVRKIVLALSAEAALPSQTDADKKDAAAIAEGRKLIAGDSLGDATGCASCHKFGEAGSLGTGPDLTGYGSRNWLDEFISNPSHERFYDGNNDGMPAFLPAEQGSPQNMISRDDLLLIVDWLRGDWPR